MKKLTTAYQTDDGSLFATIQEAQEFELAAFLLNGLPEGAPASKMAAWIMEHKIEFVDLLQGRATRKYTRKPDKSAAKKPSEQTKP